MGSGASLMWGMLFGSVGLGFFVYGKKQQRMIPLAAGIGLMVFPYFVTDPILIVVIGIALMALPYFYRE